MSSSPTTTWDAGVLASYEAALWTGVAVRLTDGTGAELPFDLSRWLRSPDGGDESMLRRCAGPTLDIGCGPGRLTAALAGRGVPALGVDVAGTAVAITRAAGAAALRRSVFDRVPGAGRWHRALLADGNVGIGGDPAGLLGRLRDLLGPAGLALVEVDPDPDRFDRVTAHLSGPADTAPATFPWSRLGRLALTDLAVPLGFTAADAWTHGERAFVALRRRAVSVRGS